MTRILKGNQTGERWDKVTLDNGITGYIYQTYITEMSSAEIENKITGISLDQSEIYMAVGDDFKINATVEPIGVNNNKVIYSSSNEEIATITENGIISAKTEGTAIITATSDENQEIKAECKLIVVKKINTSELYFDTSLNVNSSEITGINYNENTVKDVKSKIITDFEIDIINYQGNVLEDTDIVGTGCKIQVKQDGNILMQYQIIVYGDVDGNGKINSVDLLVLQRHILKIEELEPIFKKAANINKNGNNPSSVDLLLIQRHILKLQIIEQ